MDVAHIDLWITLAEIKAELRLMTWEMQSHGIGSHFTGRGPKWTVQLVTLASGERMGAATAGTLVMRLPDDLALEAKEQALSKLESK